jgi:hypothetical protein
LLCLLLYAAILARCGDVSRTEIIIPKGQTWKWSCVFGALSQQQDAKASEEKADGMRSIHAASYTLPGMKSIVQASIHAWRMLERRTGCGNESAARGRWG